MIYKFNKKNATYEKVTTKLLLIIIASVLTLISALLVWSNTMEPKFITGEVRTIIIEKDMEFTKHKLKEYILDLNLKFPHIVLAQAELESGNFSSTIFIENNNIFGMKCAKQRPSTNTGENRGHAYFNNWKDCVIDYAFYQARYLSKINSEQEYLDYLKQNYAEDTLYVQKLLNIIEKNN